MRKLKFYLIGLIPGCFLMFFILNQKGVSCSGYLPNSRVITETLSKEFEYSEVFKAALAQHHISEQFVKDTLVPKGDIDFDKSKAQQKPCPEYWLEYHDQQKHYGITFEKCEDKAYFKTLETINTK